MEKEKVIYKFNDLISILMKDNLNIDTLFRRNGRLTPEQFLDYSEKYKQIEKIFIKSNEKNYYYDVMDYAANKSLERDLIKEKKRGLNLKKITAKISMFWLLAGVSLNQALIMHKNNHKYALFIFFLCFAFISASLSVFINNEDELKDKLIREKVGLLDENQRRKLLVLFILGERKWLGGENMIEHIIKDKELYLKIKQIHDGDVKEKEVIGQLYKFINRD